MGTPAFEGVGNLSIVTSLRPESTGRWLPQGLDYGLLWLDSRPYWQTDIRTPILGRML
jgi:hypothetical protein